MLDLAVLPDHPRLALAPDALPTQFLRHIHRLGGLPARPTHAADVLLKLAHAGQKQLQRIDMPGPHFAYFGRLRLNGLGVFGLRGLQAKGAQ